MLPTRSITDNRCLGWPGGNRAGRQRGKRSEQPLWAAIFGLSGLRATSGVRQMTSRSPSEPRSLLPPSLYEAEFVKARCENSFLFILIHFGRRLATTHLL